MCLFSLFYWLQFLTLVDTVTCTTSIFNTIRWKPSASRACDVGCIARQPFLSYWQVRSYLGCHLSPIGGIDMWPPQAALEAGSTFPLCEFCMRSMNIIMTIDRFKALCEYYLDERQFFFVIWWAVNLYCFAFITKEKNKKKKWSSITILINNFEWSIAR